MRLLFVEPEFPVPKKSINHSNFVPIGLLKLHEYYRSKGYKTKLIRGNKRKQDIGTRFTPEKIYITSLFTYWSHYVWDTVGFYRAYYPSAEIIVGGIYASLLGNTIDFKNNLEKYNAEVFIGLHDEAEDYAANHKLDYTVLDVNNNNHHIDYQIIHSSRGCFRKCKFCGTWKIEPAVQDKESIIKEISSKKIVFYDNNFLNNIYVENILNELISEREGRNFIKCESQSGFDGRILLQKPYLSNLLKKAGFIYPRIAWDNGFKDLRDIEKQIELLLDAGFPNNEMFVFILFNYNVPFNEVEKKRLKCWDWKVQITDCRFRPLDQTFDNFNPFVEHQTIEDYYIHPSWTDSQIRQFRRNVRRQNICIRQRLKFFSRTLEKKRVTKEESVRLRSMPKRKIKKNISDAWFPEDLSYG